MPESASAKERELIKRVIATNTHSSGTLRSHMFAGTGSSVKVPSRIKKCCDLRTLPHADTYQLLLKFMQQTVWPDRRIANEFNVDPDCITFSSTSSARLFPVIAVNSTRFGSIMDKRSTNDRFGCVDFKTSRVPCKILYHFELAIPGSIILCSVVQRMFSDDSLPVFPWSLYSTDLGVYVAYADKFHAPEVVVSSQLSAPVAIVPIRSKVLGQEVPLWAVHSFDRVRTQFITPAHF